MAPDIPNPTPTGNPPNNAPDPKQPPTSTPPLAGNMSTTMTPAKNKQLATPASQVPTEDCPKCGGHNPDCVLCKGTGKIEAKGVTHTPPSTK